MSTDPILSIDRCFEEMYPSATEDVQCLAVLSLDTPERKRFPREHQVVKLPKRITHRKKEILRTVASRIPNPDKISAMSLIKQIAERALS